MITIINLNELNLRLREKVNLTNNPKLLNNLTIKKIPSLQKATLFRQKSNRKMNLQRQENLLIKKGK